jgi:hypothetical protein
MADEVLLTVTPAAEVVVNVTATEPPVVQLTVAPTPEVVRSFAIGPQGPPGTNGGLVTLPDVNSSGKIDKSLLYYDAASGQFKLDALVTTTTITDGGNY